MNTLKMLNTAKAYATRGWSVIPVSRDKMPLIPWKEYQEKIADEKTIDSWFLLHPDAQVGIVTGKISNLSVVDVEIEGDPSFLPQDTMVVMTQRGGWHYYYQYAPGLKNSARKMAPYTDVRSEGGFVVAPPSEGKHGCYLLIQDVDLLPFPVDLVPKEPEYVSGSVISSTPLDLDNYSGSGQGGRNDSMTKYAGRILPEIHPLDWDTTGWQAFQEANRKNSPPLAERELRTIWESIKNKEKLSPSLRKGGTKFSVNIEKPEEVIRNSKGEVLDDKVVTIDEAAEAEEINLNEPIPTGITMLDDALLGGIRPGDLVSLSGISGHGKTLMSQTITANIVERGIPVIYFTYEVLVNEILDKFKEMEVSNRGLIFTPRVIKTGKTSWVREKVKEAKIKGAKVVVIDHLEFLTFDVEGKNMNYNFSTKVSETVKEIKNIARVEQVAIILLFHLRKINQGRPTLNDAKDSISIVQESDVGLIIERERSDREESGDEFFKPTSILSLQKNRRKGGRTCYIKMNLLQGRLVEASASAEPVATKEDAWSDLAMIRQSENNKLSEMERVNRDYNGE